MLQLKSKKIIENAYILVEEKESTIIPAQLSILEMEFCKVKAKSFAEAENGREGEGKEVKVKKKT